MNPDYQPAADSVFAGAVDWLQATLLGTVATSVAVIAVAFISFQLFFGRIDVRRAAQVIFGCFILFGASSIAAGIVRAANSGTAGTEPPPDSSPPAYAAPAPPPPATAMPYDPYAGAAVPPRP